jgi:hypothetical protein
VPSWWTRRQLPTSATGPLSTEGGGHEIECAGKVEVVTVEPTHDFTGGSTKSLVNRVCLAGIRFGDPVVEASFVVLDDRGAFVGAASVDDEVFEIRIVLKQHRSQRALKV